jgi:hypothetical protein
VLRIGTFNMGHERNASPMVLKRQLDFMVDVDCDIWLLTEVPYTFKTVAEPGTVAVSESMDRTHKVYAAVWAKARAAQEPEIHDAAALATVAGRRVCSCMFAAGDTIFRDWPDEGFDRPTVLRAALARLKTGLGSGATDLVLGGHWSQELAGENLLGTPDGREMIGEFLAALDLQVPTADLPRSGGDEDEGRSIEHIAVPGAWRVNAATRLVADIEGHPRGARHDVYVVEVEP